VQTIYTILKPLI